MAEFEEVDEFAFEACLLPRAQAHTFCDYLNSIGIRARTKLCASGKYAVCVTTREDALRAKREAIAYARSPYSRRYAASGWLSQGRLKDADEIRPAFFNLLSFDFKSLTTIVELVCVLFFACQFFYPRRMVELFALTEPLRNPLDYYRLLSPCFLHFGLLHLAFNLVMWEALARPAEKLCGTARLFSIFICVALLSNVLQLYFATENTVFGGLSGVVYGMIGFTGILSRDKRRAHRLKIPPGLLLVSVIFIGLGFFMGGIANFCHLGGLVLGMLWGWFETGRKA